MSTSVNGSKILDVDRFMNTASRRRTKEDISLCSWLLALENSLIGLGGRGRGGVKKAGGLLVTLSDGDSLVHLASRRGLSLLVLGLTGPQGLSLAAIPATLLPSSSSCQTTTHPFLTTRILSGKKSESIPDQTGGELLKSFRGHLC